MNPRQSFLWVLLVVLFGGCSALTGTESECGATEAAYPEVQFTMLDDGCTSAVAGFLDTGEPDVGEVVVGMCNTCSQRVALDFGVRGTRTDDEVFRIGDDEVASTAQFAPVIEFESPEGETAMAGCTALRSTEEKHDSVSRVVVKPGEELRLNRPFRRVAFSGCEPDCEARPFGEIGRINVWVPAARNRTASFDIDDTLFPARACARTVVSGEAPSEGMPRDRVVRLSTTSVPEHLRTAFLNMSTR